MLINLALWYLRKRKCSVLMNYRIEQAKLKQLQNDGNIYDCELGDIEHYLPDGQKFDIPTGNCNFRQIKGE